MWKDVFKEIRNRKRHREDESVACRPQNARIVTISFDLGKVPVDHREQENWPTSEMHTS